MRLTQIDADGTVINFVRHFFFRDMKIKEKKKRNLQTCVKEKMKEEMDMVGREKKKETNVGLVCKKYFAPQISAHSTSRCRTFFFFFFFFLAIGKQMCMQGGASDKFTVGPLLR